MNYTEKFFEFPIRVYDSFERRRSMEKEERAFENDPDLAVPEDCPWVNGTAAVLPEHIIGYMDSFSKGKHFEEVEIEGCDLLIVETKLQGDFLCTWTREQFKKKLNIFMTKYDELLREELKSSPAISTFLLQLPPADKKD
jgi:hypothetical protein